MGQVLKLWFPPYLHSAALAPLDLFAVVISTSAGFMSNLILSPPMYIRELSKRGV